LLVMFWLLFLRAPCNETYEECDEPKLNQ
jgi:hypothetical protein